MSQKIKTSVEIDGSLKASQIANATTDTDKFLVSDSGTVKYRTGAEVLSDLGITVNTASKLQHQVKAGVAINKGQAVYVTSADGTNMIVGLASNASEATSSKTMGLLDGTVAINGFANVVTEGLLSGLSITGAVSEGDPVWLGTGGNLIYGLTNKPSAPNHLVFIGIVTRVNANNGEIFVKVQNGFELNEIHDVDLKTTLPSGNDILAFEGAPVNLWKNKTIASVLGYTPYNASNPAGYISSYTETDPTVPSHVKSITTTDKSNWNTAYGWGNHASAGYLTSVTNISGNAGTATQIYQDNEPASGTYRLLLGNASDTTGYAYNFNSLYFNRANNTIQGANISGNAATATNADYANSAGTAQNATSAINLSGNINFATSGISSMKVNDTRYWVTDPNAPGNYFQALTMGNGSDFTQIGVNSSQEMYFRFNGSGNIWNTVLSSNNYSSFAVPLSRTITINGTSYDLSANRSWTVTANAVETDTLATVTGRGASTSTLSTFDGGLNIGNTKLRWGGNTTPTLGLPFSGSTNAFWIDVNDGDTGGLMVDNEGVTVYGAGDNGYVFRVIDEDVYQATTNVAASTTFQVTQGQNGGGFIKGNFDISGYVTIGGSAYLASSNSLFFDSGVTNDYSIKKNGTALQFDSGGDFTFNKGVNILTTRDNALVLRAMDGGTNPWNYIEYVNSAGTRKYYVGTDTSNVFNIYSDDGTGYVYSNTSFRAPIFYDSNNTGYYADFASTGTSLNIAGSVNAATYNKPGLLVNSSGTASTGAAFAIQQVTSEGWTGIFVDFEPNTGWGLYHDNPSNYFLITAETTDGNIGSNVVPSRSSGNRTAYTKFQFQQTDGIGIAGGSWRAPIFYDYNNTGYYLDPASTSNLALLSLYGHDNQLKINTYSGGAAGWFAQEAGTNKWETYHYQGRYRWYNYTTNQEEAFFDNASGYFQVRTSVRAPIFYDSDNTGYYIDPNATSNLVNIGLNGYINFNGSGTSVRISESYGILMNCVSTPWNVQMINTSLLVGLSASGGNYGIGNGYFTGDVTAYYSDRRLKHNLVLIDNAVDKVKSLNGYTYQHNELGQELLNENAYKLHAGLIAQEVQAVLPEVVTIAPFDLDGYDEQGKGISKSGENYLTIKYERIVPLLIEAIKEQQTQIEELKELVNKLINK